MDIKLSKRVNVDASVADTIKASRKQTEAMVEVAAVLINPCKSEGMDRACRAQEMFEKALGEDAPALLRSLILQHKVGNLIRTGEVQGLADLCSLDSPSIGGAADKDKLVQLNSSMFEDGFAFLLQSKSPTAAEISKAAQLCDSIMGSHLLGDKDVADLKHFSKILTNDPATPMTELQESHKHLDGLKQSMDYNGLLKGTLTKCYEAIHEHAEAAWGGRAKSLAFETQLGAIATWNDQVRHAIRSVEGSDVVPCQNSLPDDDPEVQITNIFATIEAGDVGSKNLSNVKNLMNVLADTGGMVASYMFQLLTKYMLAEEKVETLVSRSAACCSCANKAVKLMNAIEIGAYIGSTLPLWESFHLMKTQQRTAISSIETALNLAKQTSAIFCKVAELSDGHVFTEPAFREVATARQNIDIELQVVKDYCAEACPTALAELLVAAFATCFRRADKISEGCRASTIGPDISAFKETKEEYIKTYLCLCILQPPHRANPYATNHNSCRSQP